MLVRVNYLVVPLQSVVSEWSKVYVRTFTSFSSRRPTECMVLDVQSFDTISSASAWEGGISSPMLGAGPPSAVNSPMLGSGGQPGSTANPPGSLGSKWELLGIGNDLFRAIAKYG